jgi:hypothetical protein
MLYNLIAHKAKEWFNSERCTIRPILDYINASQKYLKFKI